MPNVTFILPQLAKVMREYETIRDCLEGGRRLREVAAKYFTFENFDGNSVEDQKKLKEYLKRAVFYNITRRTLNGFIGEVFSSDPVIDLPGSIQFLADDTTGSGVDIIQHSKKTLGLTLAYSRAGLLVDYPDTAGEGVTREQLLLGAASPTIKMFSPLNIVNWRTFSFGSKQKLSLVVILEPYPYGDDGFEVSSGAQYRVLSLDENGLYRVDVWREESPSAWDGYSHPSKTKKFMTVESFNPTDFNGNRLDYIPFTFIGSVNNDCEIDNPNFYDIADLNIAHWRNSAQYEDMLNYAGQPTMVVSGLTQDWYENQLNKTIRVGVKGGLPLPDGGDAKYIQAEANSVAKEAMDDKERQMVALGAKLVEEKTVQRTATEASQDNSRETSILASVANNVSSAYKWCLQKACDFTGDDPNAIEFKLNTDFAISRLSSADRAEVVAEWSKGALSFGEMRNILRKTGAATEDDNAVKAEFEAEQQKSFDRQTALAAASTKPAV